VIWAGLFRLMATAARRQRQDATENERLLQHDPLTGLPNRALFVERATQAVVAVPARAPRPRCSSRTWTTSRRSTTPSATTLATG
jgi:hypothetical protein